ncbi:chitobiase/beta-hexosaminidase C-terminal domain-containing protein [Saccharicrinis fermentans]|uniref:chitobiase/beta-hexosaminidase C-terminal domain-containing protein n=1 Tax=Saccharicrinis fermentans TaxID=982 RepID=UPI000488CEF0|nr:chitobiase/beta-hexosaminidase C-terminal domain-containing protein [Saccharicrinis fermentans]
MDGSEPTIHSPLYSGTIKLTQSTHIKTQTFDSNGNPVGFTNEARFNKVNKVEYPSWYSTLLAGKYTGSQKKEATKAIKMMVNGALMVNIADDPDLIDASGGYNTGCFIRSIDPLKGKAWLDAGLSETWIIQQVNNNDVHNTSELQDILQENVGKTIHIKAVRNYGQNIFKIKL